MEGTPKKTASSNLVNKAQWRVAECETELRGISQEADGRRYRKVLHRIEQYRELVTHLEARKVEDPNDQLEALEGELGDLRGRILDAARTLVTTRDAWQELKLRWGRVADRIMEFREAQGKPAGRVPRLDFSFPAPAPGAPLEDRDAHDLIRSLNL